MEMRMTTDLTTALPAEIIFNFDELKIELTERLHHYNTLVVTEDAIKEAKEDLAKLRKLKEAIENRRKEVKRMCLEPYNAFESKVKELTALIDAPVGAINGQIKSFDEQEKSKKRSEIEAAYNELVPEAFKDIIPLDRIFDPRWLNKGTTMKSIQEAITKKMQRVNADMTVLDMVDPKYLPAVKAKYIETLDIAEALNHRDQIEAAEQAFKQQEEARQQRAAQRAAWENHAPQAEEKTPVAAQEPVREPAPQPRKEEKMYALRLEFQLTMQQADALKAFLINNHINYTKI